MVVFNICDSNMTWRRVYLLWQVIKVYSGFLVYRTNCRTRRFLSISVPFLLLLETTRLRVKIFKLFWCCEVIGCFAMNILLLIKCSKRKSKIFTTMKNDEIFEKFQYNNMCKFGNRQKILCRLRNFEILILIYCNLKRLHRFL